jgi:hypothetical protein
MALRIAAACADDELAGELKEDVWQIVNSADADRLSWLAVAIRAIGRLWPKERLMRFIRGELPPGRHWEYRGAALVALFDKRRSAMPAGEHAHLHEVAPFFAENPTGVRSSYDTFIRRSHEHLSTTDLDDVCGVLTALRKWSTPLDSMSPVKKLTVATLQALVKLMPDPRATAALADWWLSRIQEDDYYLPGKHGSCTLAEIGLADPQKRQALLAAVIASPTATTLGPHGHYLLPCEPADFPWLLAQLPGCTGVAEELIARLVQGDIRNRTLRESNRAALQTAFAASAELRALLPAAPSGDIHAALDALEQEHERTRAAQMAKLAQGEIKKRPSYNAEMNLLAAIDGCARGEMESWPLVLYAAGMFDPRNQDTQVWFATQPDELPGWKTIPEDARAAVARAARDFLLHHAPELPDSNKQHLNVEAIRHALCLLRHQLAIDSELRAAFRPEWPEIILRALYPLKPPLPEVLAILHQINAPATLACVRAKLEADWARTSTCWRITSIHCGLPRWRPRLWRS